MARPQVNKAPLWRLSVVVPTESEEAVSQCLERSFGQPAAVYTPDGKDLSTITIYSSLPISEIKRRQLDLNSALREMTRFGLRVGRPKIVLERVPREDWTTSWKKFFKALNIGSALLVRPSWSKKAPRLGQAVVTLDPGLSFGTGQHPTTAFCLEQIVAARRAAGPLSLLDIGTGSGILAIAAAKLGYAPVRGFDNDPVAVRVALANARRNRILARVEISREDLTGLPMRAASNYNVICANLVQDLLLSERDRILNRLAPGGILVLAGLLTRQFGAVGRAYRAAGLRLQTARTEGEWRSGAFLRPG